MEDYKILYEQTKKLVEEYQNVIIPGFKEKIKELEADNTRLRDMWADAVSDASKANSQIKHGHWIYKPYEGDDNIWLYHCSNCQSPNAQERNYCNSCGAIMDGETVEQSM